jgi:phosphoribosyl 1,2-cyclic phosphodiesterase
MKVHILASGSKGNAAYAEIDGVRLIVDVGISARRLKEKLSEIEVAPESLDGILITHEHRDHINGLATFCKNYSVPIYSRAATFAAMYCYDKLPQENLQAIKDSFSVKNLHIEAFNISHDAADPVGYNIYSRSGKKFTLATDLGFVTSSVQAAIDNTDVLVLEANHDINMLKRGSYPFSLKQRILGNRGHLSNEEAAWTLVRMKRPQKMKVVLAHLSEDNNRPEIASETIKSIIEGQGIDARAVEIMLAAQGKAVAV